MMNSELVKVERVAFGSPGFMFLRTDINILMREREALRNYFHHSEYEVRYRWICNTIRAMASLVFFRCGQFRMFPSSSNGNTAQITEYKKALSPKEQQRADKRKMLEEKMHRAKQQKSLF